MKAHLIRSAEVDQELFTDVTKLLQSIPGPIQFCYKDESVVNNEENEQYGNAMPDPDEIQRTIVPPIGSTVTDWGTLFEECKEYRSAKNIPDNEFVFLLTERPNEENWFSSLDDAMPYNGFIHTAEWDQYINCSSVFPVAYEVLALMLQKHMFRNKEDLLESVHENPLGCINDMCTEKKQVILRLRTADICESCMSRIIGIVPLPDIHHALALLETLRIRMLYAQNFRQQSAPSKLVVDGQRKIFLTDYGNIEIDLFPTDKALYILFLRYPEGIPFNLLPDHREELHSIYSSIPERGNRLESERVIENLLDLRANNASIGISRIKREFEKVIGKELARHYYIEGERATERKIRLNRNLVTELPAFRNSDR